MAAGPNGIYVTQTGTNSVDNQVLLVSGSTVTELAGNNIGSGPFFGTGLNIGIAVVPNPAPAGPTIIVSPTSLTLGTTTFGAASTSQSYRVSGSQPDRRYRRHAAYRGAVVAGQ